MCVPFVSSASRADNNFDLIHSDWWTSPIVSISWCKYYLVILDDCSHLVCSFPLHAKSNTFLTLSDFSPLSPHNLATPSKPSIVTMAVKFDNASSRAFFATSGVILWMFCPYTSSQNGKVELTLRTINNMIHSLLFQASM
jgi:hypothetical protein